MLLGDKKGNMHKREDVEAFLIEKFLTGKVIKLFIADSVRFRMGLVSKGRDYFPKHELEFVLGGLDLVLEFQEWEKEKYLPREVPTPQQAEILINSQ